MRFKKGIVGILSVLMLLGLCACGEDAQEQTQPKDLGTAQTPQTSASEPEQTSPSGETTEPATEPKNEIPVADVEETVIYDADGVKVTILGLEHPVTGTGLRMRIENASDDEMGVNVNWLVYNGITIHAGAAFAAKPGETAEATLLVSRYELERANIETVTTISAGDMELVKGSSMSHVCDLPFKLTTSAADSYTHVIDESGTVLWEGNGLTVIAKTGYLDQDLEMECPLVLIKNTSGDDIWVDCEDLSVNGTSMYEYLYGWVYDGTAGYLDFDLDDSDLEDASIEQIETMTFDLEIEWEDDEMLLEDLTIDLTD